MEVSASPHIQSLNSSITSRVFNPKNVQRSTDQFTFSAKKNSVITGKKAELFIENFLEELSDATPIKQQKKQEKTSIASDILSFIFSTQKKPKDNSFHDNPYKYIQTKNNNYTIINSNEITEQILLNTKANNLYILEKEKTPNLERTTQKHKGQTVYQFNGYHRITYRLRKADGSFITDLGYKYLLNNQTYELDEGDSITISKGNHREAGICKQTRPPNEKSAELQKKGEELLQSLFEKHSEYALKTAQKE